MMERRSHAYGAPIRFIKATMTVNMDIPGPMVQMVPAFIAVLISSLVSPTMGPALIAWRIKTTAWAHRAITVGITAIHMPAPFAIAFHPPFVIVSTNPFIGYLHFLSQFKLEHPPFQKGGKIPAGILLILVSL